MASTSKNYDKIKKQYNVPAKYGARVRYTFGCDIEHGKDAGTKAGTHDGIITSCDGAHIRIRFDGRTSTHSAGFHPTSVIYL